MGEARYEDVKKAATQAILEMRRKDALGSPTSCTSSSPTTDSLNDSADEDASRSALKKLYGHNPIKTDFKKSFFNRSKV